MADANTNWEVAFDLGVDLAFEQVEAIRIASVQDTVEVMLRAVGNGGRMRVDTGFLRSSLVASTAAMPLIDPAGRPVEGQSYAMGNYDAAIMGAGQDDEIYLGFTASYAGAREVKDHFVEGAFLDWSATVRRNEAAARERL